MNHHRLAGCPEELSHLALMAEGSGSGKEVCGAWMVMVEVSVQDPAAPSWQFLQVCFPLACTSCRLLNVVVLPISVDCVISKESIATAGIVQLTMPCTHRSIQLLC